MGGYAAYVWPVYGVGLILIVGVAMTPRYLYRRMIANMRDEYGDNESNKYKSEETN